MHVFVYWFVIGLSVMHKQRLKPIFIRNLNTICCLANTVIPSVFANVVVGFFLFLCYLLAAYIFTL